jgi:hypothetical protein
MMAAVYASLFSRFYYFTTTFRDGYLFKYSATLSLCKFHKFLIGKACEVINLKIIYVKTINALLADINLMMDII